MRYLDELLLLYSSADPLARRYFLSCMSRIPWSFDSQAAIEVLWRDVADPAAPIRRMARWELGRVLPSYLGHAYGLERGSGGVWTGYFRRDDALKLLATQQVAREPESMVATLVTRASERLTPVLAQAGRLLGAPDPAVRSAASLVLGRSPAAVALPVLGEHLDVSAVRFGAAAALAGIDDSAARAMLLAHVTRWCDATPDLVLTLGALEAGATRELLSSFAARTTADGRSCVAVALGRDPSPAGRELVARLLERHEGWVTAYCLDAMFAHPAPGDLKLLSGIYASASHEFLRALAVRTVGATPGEDSIAFLLDRIRDGSPRVQAAALEGLASQDLAPADLAAQGFPLLGNALLKTRVNAILAVGHVDPEAAARAVRMLLFSDAPVERLEAAFILGYLGDVESAIALTEMVQRDPHPAVRVQAVKSLAKHVPERSVPLLVSLLSGSDPAVLTAVAQPLAFIGEGDLAVVSDALARACLVHRRKPIASGLLRALGAAVARRPDVQVPGALLEALARREPSELPGAVSGLKLLGDRAGVPELAALLTSDLPQVRADAAVAAILAGQPDASRHLGTMLASGRPEEELPALGALLEVLSVLSSAVRSTRFLALRTALGGTGAGAPAVRPGVPGGVLIVRAGGDAGAPRDLAPGEDPEATLPSEGMPASPAAQDSPTPAPASAPAAIDFDAIPDEPRRRPLAAASPAAASEQVTERMEVPGETPDLVAQGSAGDLSPAAGSSAAAQVPHTAAGPPGSAESRRASADQPDPAEIRRSGARPPGAFEVRWPPARLSGIAGAGQELKAHYARRSAGGSGRAGAMEAVDEVSYFVGLSSIPGSVLVRLRSLAPIGTLAVLLLALAIGVATHRAGPPPASADKTRADRLRVTLLHGAATLREGVHPQRPLLKGDEVGPGDRISISGAGQVQLSGAHQFTVWLGPESTVTLSGPPTAWTTQSSAPVSLADPEGDVIVNSRECGGVQLLLDAGRVEGRYAVIRLQSQPGGRSLSAIVGWVEFTAVGEPARPVAVGSTLSIVSP